MPFNTKIGVQTHIRVEVSVVDVSVDVSVVLLSVDVSVVLVSVVVSVEVVLVSMLASGVQHTTFVVTTLADSEIEITGRKN